MREDFVNSIKTHQKAFGQDISEAAINRLANYYELILEHNQLLHLVAPCSAEEFAIRHILESLTLLDHLPQNARFADVGAGAGLPSIPCLLVRDDLRAVLIESKPKKAGFLQTVLAECELGERVQILDRQFSETAKPYVSYVTCRALDKFTQKLPQLLKWCGNCDLLLFGGKSLRDGLTTNGIEFGQKLMPLSEQRFLFYTPRKDIDSSTC